MIQSPASSVLPPSAEVLVSEGLTFDKQPIICIPLIYLVPLCFALHSGSRYQAEKINMALAVYSPEFILVNRGPEFTVQETARKPAPTKLHQKVWYSHSEHIWHLPPSYRDKLADPKGQRQVLPSSTERMIVGGLFLVL
jgi:hypothetical protein